MHFTQPVTLRAVNTENRDAIVALRVAENQRRFIAPNSRTLAQAATAPEAWLRAIYADEMPVGLVLLHDEHLRNPPREIGYYFLWRLMIDAGQQRKGYGRRTLDLVVTHVSTRPHAEKLLSNYLPGAGGAEAFSHHYGFAPTGRRIGEDVEVVLRLRQDPLFTDEHAETDTNHRAFAGLTPPEGGEAKRPQP